MAPFTNGGLVVIWYFTTVGFIDIELVGGANHGTDDRINVFPFQAVMSRYLTHICMGFAGSILV